MFKSFIAKLKRFANPMPALSSQRAAIEAWSLSMGREAAEMWLEALAVRDAQPV